MSYEVVWDGSHGRLMPDAPAREIYKDRDADMLAERQWRQRYPHKHRGGWQRNYREYTPAKPNARRHYNLTDIERFCQECGQQFFLRWPSEGARHGGRRYCNATCASIATLRKVGIPFDPKNKKPQKEQTPEKKAADLARGKTRYRYPLRPCEVCGTRERVMVKFQVLGLLRFSGACAQMNACLSAQALTIRLLPRTGQWSTSSRSTIRNTRAQSASAS